MARSSQKFSVFEFDEEEEKVEKESARFVGKFRIQKRRRNSNNKDDDTSPRIKYKSLQCFGGCTGAVKIESSNELIDIDHEPIDVDCGGETNSLCKGNSNEVVDIDPTDVEGQCQYSVSAPACMPQEDCSVKEISRLDRLFSFSNYENESVGRILDNDGIEMSSSTSVSTHVENAGNQVLKCGSVGHKIDCTNNTVAVFPDYILCGDVYGAEYCLTFSGSSIRMEGSTANGVKGIFNAEWTLGDIISIESEWCGMVTTAMVYICFKSKVSQGAGNTNDTSGVDKLKFSVCDPLWNEGEEAIKSLHVRYRDSWNVTSESDWKNDGNAFFGHNEMVIAKPYFPVLHETFEEVIYPKGDPDAVSISKRDVELLRPGTFINDTIIDFYILYLKSKLKPGDKHRFHFFNSFFFRKLADLDKGPSNACGGRLAFQRVHKWTRKMNLFEKDYIFIPINYSLHWSLIVICHPGEVVHSREDEGRNSVKVPCILHMDSIRGSHRGLKNLIQSYLYEEWRERHNGTVDDTLLKFLHLRFVPLELPQQENSYDCGLFVLHYVERFLEEAPINFSPFKITEFSNFLNRNWFLPVEASLKRACIQKLICEILEDWSSTQFSDPYEEETGVEFLEEISSSVSGTGTDTGINISVTTKSPMRVAHQQQPGELGLNSRNLLEPGTRARSLSNEDCWQTGTIHGSSCISPVEEIGERISDSSSDTEDYLQPTGLATEFPSTTFSHKNLGSLGSSSSNKKYMQIEEPYDDCSSEASISGSLKSSEIGVGVDEDHFLSQIEGSDHQTQTNCHELSSKSIESEEFADCVVEDSEEGNNMHNDQVADDSPSSLHCNDLVASIDAIKATESILRKVRKPVCNVDLASDEQTRKDKAYIF
ncbi:ubiquitin-like-specific protease 2A isoform X1 [Populus alba x Populus x berolinensis]|nr:ubiquitin-like-specific protease 2A isoform X1 [Populus alba x Populus x berolinensis]